MQLKGFYEYGLRLGPQEFLYNLSRYTLEAFYKSSVSPSLKYSDVVWDGCSESDRNLLERLKIDGASGKKQVISLK